MSLAGHLLVASRQLRDPNFRRTVVLLLEHNDDGALGVVLNRPTNRTIEDVWEAVEFEPCDNQQPLNLGGPVPGPLIALHTSKQLGEKRILPGLYLSMQKENVDPLVRQSQHRFRLYSGNSGWGGGQLESELGQGGWLTIAGGVEDVFGDFQTVWAQVTKRIALDIMLPGLDPDEAPEDPTLN
ncbi:YqgE/AlgH family protein [Botrimarina hoheduenensis]|uniref:YqgE/AlgH family protein n=1 Tax=Botrimarina hoheduenensis TaxID=2528000 RepID=UPI0018D3633A|nr:YqgE/AlgH family protein [Botrimarina hoheduenensis]